jgi:transposase
VLGIKRVYCKCCNVLRQVKVGFADYQRSYTKAFERYALGLSQHMTIKDVANHLNISWDVIKEIQKRSLKKSLLSQSSKNYGTLLLMKSPLENGKNT